MIILDYRDKRPIYEQIVEKFAQLIACGVLSPGDKMPSVRQLAVDLSINPNTIQRAYATLEQAGYIYTAAGRGGFVAEPESWQGGRHSELMGDLEKLLLKAREAGISAEAVTSLVHTVFEKERKEDAK